VLLFESLPGFASNMEQTKSQSFFI